jgi:hypothetical protein
LAEHAAELARKLADLSIHRAHPDAELHTWREVQVREDSSKNAEKDGDNADDEGETPILLGLQKEDLPTTGDRQVYRKRAESHAEGDTAGNGKPEPSPDRRFTISPTLLAALEDQHQHQTKSSPASEAGCHTLG